MIYVDRNGKVFTAELAIVDEDGVPGPDGVEGAEGIPVSDAAYEKLLLETAQIWALRHESKASHMTRRDLIEFLIALVLAGAAVYFLFWSPSR